MRFHRTAFPPLGQYTDWLVQLASISSKKKKKTFEHTDLSSLKRYGASYPLWQEVDAHGVFAGVCPELNLCQHLIGEGVAHDEAGVAHGTAQVNQSALSQDDDVVAVLEAIAVHLTGHTQ